MPKEKPEFQLKRLRVEQDKTRQDEVFGGLSPAERAAFDAKTKRINELEIELAAVAFAKKSEQHAKANQRVQWNKEPETDVPQGEAHQPYRGRENESASLSQGSTKKRGKGTRESEKKSRD